MIYPSKTNFKQLCHARLGIVCILFIAILDAYAQDKAPGASPDLINISVTVLDHHERPVPSLKKEDFRIFENNVEQAPTRLTGNDLPISVMVLINVGGSMPRLSISSSISALESFVRKLNDDDLIIVASYSHHIYPIIEPTKIKDLDGEIEIELRPWESETLVYDAVAFAQKTINKIPGRRAIIVLGDGNDAGVAASFKSTLRMAEEEDALIYTVQVRTFAYPPFDDPKKFAKNTARARQYMMALAEKTGGRHFMIDDITDLGATFASIAGELRQQYTLGYYSNQPGKDGERRKITVKVNVPNVAVRSRSEVVYKKSKH